MRIHQIVQHRPVMGGIEPMTIVTEHAFPRHAHDQFGIGIVTSGAQRSWSVLGTVESRAGDVIMVNPEEIHDGAPMGGARSWQIIYLDPALVAREMADEDVAGQLVMRPVVRDRRLARQVRRLFAELTMPAPDLLAARESLLCCLMTVAHRHRLDAARTPSASTSVSGSVARAVERMESAPDAAVTLDELAALSGVSRFQLVRAFARHVGITPHAYLVQLRVRLARRLLAAGVPPAETAQRAGFVDQSHLTRAFARQLGVTPGTFRARRDDEAPNRSTTPVRAPARPRGR